MGRQRRYPRRPASRSLLGQPLAWQRHPAHRPEAGPRPGGGRCRAASPPHAAPYSPLAASHSPRPLPAAPGTAPWHRGSGDCRQPRTRETARSGVASRVSTGRGAQVGPVSESRPRPRPRPRPGGLCHRSWGGGPARRSVRRQPIQDTGFSLPGGNSLASASEPDLPPPVVAGCLAPSNWSPLTPVGLGLNRARSSVPPFHSTSRRELV